MSVSQILKDKGFDVATATPETSIYEVAKILSSRRIGSVVVTDPSSRLIGIVTERDIIRALAKSGEGCLRDTIQTIMTKDVTTCGEHDPVTELMGIMTTGRFRHIPVVENDQLIGIVSIGDVVKSRIAEVEMEATALKTYVAGG